MTKIDIVSGFLGAGKTTFIQKMLKEALVGEQVVLIENEFGEIGIDGGFLKESGIEIKEMNSGCICCSLVGDFGTSLKEVIATYKPERILIEPSGVGKLSDVIKAVADIELENEEMKDVKLNTAVAVVDVSKAKMYIKNFGEFFINQVESAGTIILSRTQNVSEEKTTEVVNLLKEHNPKATIITTPWDLIDGALILKNMEAGKSLEEELMEEVKAHREEDRIHEAEHHHHHHHDEDEEDEHEHHHHHHDEDEEDEHEHHHHHHDEDEEDEHEHHHHHHDDDDEDEHEHHHHEHGEDCDCGCHDHDHHHGHHHADEVFDSIGFETPKSFTKEQIEGILDALSDEEKYGFVLRSKGMVPAKEGGFIYFDYVPEEKNVRDGAPDVTGKIVVIGAKLKEDSLKVLFGI
ncbi:MAG: GTP-binding protein [Lachnospiraceae bacterium]|nr:GTP-binding protein [Lachnospiraceae bacterium]